MDVIVSVEVGILLGVLVALALFVRMALSAGTVKSLQFQLAAFLSVWAISEIPRVLDSIGVINLGSISLYGMIIHTVSMVLFAVFVTYRFSRFVMVKK